MLDNPTRSSCKAVLASNTIIFRVLISYIFGDDSAHPLYLQQDITRGRDMVESLYQGGQGGGGTHNAMLSSQDYLSQAARDLNNIEDGFYISPAFLDKLSIHIAKNFLDLPKIKVPLILGQSTLTSASPNKPNKESYMQVIQIVQNSMLLNP